MESSFASRCVELRANAGRTVAILVALTALACLPTVAAASPHHKRHRKHHKAHPKPVLLIGLGATQQTWDSRHQADPNFAANYDPMPSGTYTQAGAFTDDQFEQVTFDDLGRVTSFQQKFVPGTAQTAASAATLPLLPSDAKRVAGPLSVSGPYSCLAEEFSSKTLAAQDGGNKTIFISYYSDYVLGISPYTSQDVREAAVNAQRGIIPPSQFGKGNFGTLSLC